VSACFEPCPKLISWKVGQGVECSCLLKPNLPRDETFMTEEQEVFLKHIQKRGLKRTAQRDLILDVFLRTEGHVSGEDLYRLVREQDPTVGQTTVYRTVRLLTEAGLAREVRFGDGRAHYEHNYKHEHHDHMICSECGKIIEFYSPELEAIQDAMAAKHKFELTEHLLRMIGICADCGRHAREKKNDGTKPPKVRAAARGSRR
jgi:Fur family transcriptional regulator, ferric uptake regulator